MNRYRDLHRSLMGTLAAVLFCVAGCNNPPGALELVVAPQKTTFSQDETPRFTATFRARQGRICIEKPRPSLFNASLEHVESGHARGQSVVVRCGMSGLFLIPAWPVMFTATRLDLADSLGRFAVLAPGRSQTFAFDLIPVRDIFYITAADDKGADARGVAALSTSLPPGRYRLHLTFDCDPLPRLMMPLFWHVYDEPVSAETEYEIIDDGGSTVSHAKSQ